MHNQLISYRRHPKKKRIYKFKVAFGKLTETMQQQPKGKYFFAVSRLNGLVIDICDSCTRAGTPVCTKPRKVSQNENQLWYEDLLTGTVRSKLNDSLCLELGGEYTHTQ